MKGWISALLGALAFFVGGVSSSVCAQDSITYSFESGLDGWQTAAVREVPSQRSQDYAVTGSYSFKVGPTECTQDCDGANEHSFVLVKDFGGQYIYSMSFWALEAPTGPVQTPPDGQTILVRANGVNIPGSTFDPGLQYGNWVQKTVVVDDSVEDLSLYLTKLTNSAAIYLDEIFINFVSPEPDLLVPQLLVNNATASREEVAVVEIELKNAKDIDIAAVGTTFQFNKYYLEFLQVEMGPASAAADKGEAPSYETIEIESTNATFLKIGVFNPENNKVINNGVVALASFRIKGREDVDFPLNVGDSTTLWVNDNGAFIFASDSLVGAFPGPVTLPPEASDPSGNPVTIEGYHGQITVKMLGDCNEDRNVRVDEVQNAINMFLGITAVTDQDSCVDDDQNLIVSIDELQEVINNFLEFPNITSPRQSAALDQPAVSVVAVPFVKPGTNVLELNALLTDLGPTKPAAVAFDLVYDHEKLGEPHIAPGLAAQVDGKQLAWRVVKPGLLRAVVFSLEKVRPLHAGSLAAITFPNAMGGAAFHPTLHIRAEAADIRGRLLPVRARVGAP